MLLSYSISIRAQPNHHNHTIFLSNINNYSQRPTITRPACIRANETCSRLNYEIPKMLDYGWCEIPPWTILQPYCRLELSSMIKQNSSPSLYKVNFLAILDGYQDATIIYTDGSKTESGVGSSFVCNGEVHSWILPADVSISTAELYAILQSLYFCNMSYKEKTFLIVCDSLSCILSIRHTFSKDPLIQVILASLRNLQLQNKCITFLWIPSHIGIEGNELADTAARQAASIANPVDIQLIRPEDVKNLVKRRILESWQNDWEQAGTKLKSIKPSVLPWRPPISLSRNERVILTRLRIGHTYVTSAYLLAGENAPQCDSCDVQLTVKHILEECPRLAAIRERHDLADTVSQILANNENSIKKVLKFLKETGLYNKL